MQNPRSLAPNPQLVAWLHNSIQRTSPASGKTGGNIRVPSVAEKYTTM
jgi:hypothetical protein